MTANLFFNTFKCIFMRLEKIPPILGYLVRIPFDISIFLWCHVTPFFQLKLSGWQGKMKKTTDENWYNFIVGWKEWRNLYRRFSSRLYSRVSDSSADYKELHNDKSEPFQLNYYKSCNCIVTALESTEFLLHYGWILSEFACILVAFWLLSTEFWLHFDCILTRFRPIIVWDLSARLISCPLDGKLCYVRVHFLSSFIANQPWHCAVQSRNSLLHAWFISTVVVLRFCCDVFVTAFALR